MRKRSPLESPLAWRRRERASHGAEVWRFVVRKARTRKHTRLGAWSARRTALAKVAAAPRNKHRTSKHRELFRNAPDSRQKSRVSHFLGFRPSFFPISQGCRAAWGFGRAKHDFRVRLSIAGATIASRARTRSRRRRPRDPAGDDDVSRAHARCRAAAERVETRARRRVPRPRRCREAAPRRRPLFHDTARGDVPGLGRMAREPVAREGKRLETQPCVHVDVPVDVERRRGGRRGVLVVTLGGSEREARILGVGSRVTS